MFLRRPIIESGDIVVKVVAGIVRMGLKKKVTISWSGGKDSAFALYKMLTSGEYDVAGLHTVINTETRRVGLHGVREELIQMQAQSIGLPLYIIYLNGSEDNAAYEKAMHAYYERIAGTVDAIMFGDIFLQDLRNYREKLLSEFPIEPVYPLWGMNTDFLIKEFIELGFKTALCSANALYFTPEQVGATVDLDFVQSLSDEVDPCGENGEFHTFVYDGPLFRKRVPINLGEIVEKKYSYTKKKSNGEEETVSTIFLFRDLLPVSISEETR